MFPRPAEIAGTFAAEREAVEASALSASEREQRLADLVVAESGAYLEQSWLWRLGHFVAPAFAPLGWDWKLSAAVIASFPAREIVVASLGTIYAVGDQGDNLEGALRERLQTATRPDGSALTGRQSRAVMRPSSPRLATHSGVCAASPPQTRYGNAVSVVTDENDAVGWLSAELHVSPPFTLITAPRSVATARTSGVMASPRWNIRTTTMAAYARRVAIRSRSFRRPSTVDGRGRAADGGQEPGWTAGASSPAATYRDRADLPRIRMP